MGKYDLPAITNFIKGRTGVAKMAYIGYSQGTTQMFYSLATPYTNVEEHLNIFIAIAPCTIIDITKYATGSFGFDQYNLFSSYIDGLSIKEVIHPERAIRQK